MKRILFILACCTITKATAMPVETSAQTIAKSTIRGQVTKMNCTLLDGSTMTIKTSLTGRSYAEKDLIEKTVQVSRKLCAQIMSSEVRMMCSDELRGVFEIETRAYPGSPETFDTLTNFAFSNNEGSVVCQ